jgi:hypothetical protein
VTGGIESHLFNEMTSALATTGPRSRVGDGEPVGVPGAGSPSKGRPRVAERHLPPEAHIDLQIGLDRLRKVQDRCREALRSLARGKMSPSAYIELLNKQSDAQKAWEKRHKKYFRDLDH